MRLADFYPEFKGWVPAQGQANGSSAPQIPDERLQTSAYLRAPLPLPLQYSPDTLKQYSRPGLSSFRNAPQSPSSFPAINAAAKSAVTAAIATAIANQPPSTGGTTTDTDIISAVNASLFGSLDVSSFASGVSPAAGGSNASDFVTPSTTGEVILSYRMNSGSNPPVFTAPWTTLNLNVNAVGRLGWQKVTTTAQVTDGYVVPGTQPWAMAMLGLASNATPVFTSLSTGNPNLPATVAGVTIAAGVGLLVFVEFASNSLFLPGVSVSDSLGNIYVPVGAAVGIRSTATQQCQISVFYCANPTGGVGATISLAGSSAGISGTAYAIYQVTGLTANAATYTFQASDATKLVQFRGAVNVFGTLPNPALAAGWQCVASNNGAGKVTISTAGPALNQGGGSIVLPPGTFVWIFSDGTNYWSTTATVLPSLASPVAHKFLTSYDPLTGAFNSAQPSLSDLTNGTTGTGTTVVLQNSATLTGVVNLPTVTLASTISNYNGIGTVSNGVPAEYATVDLTAQTAAKTTTTLYAVPAAGVGQYRVSWNAKITTVAGVSSTLGPLTIVYTDPDGVVQTITAAAQNSAGTIVISDSTGNSTTTVLLGIPLQLNCKASTNITYAFAYASNAANAMAYNLHIKLESL
jgi:hypothetical protein